MSPPDAVKHTHIHAIDLAVSNKTELAIAVRTLEQHTAGRFAIVKEDFHHISVEEDFDATHIGDAAIEIDVVHDCSLRDQSGHAVATLQLQFHRITIGGIGTGRDEHCEIVIVSQMHVRVIRVVRHNKEGPVFACMRFQTIA